MHTMPQPPPAPCQQRKIKSRNIPTWDPLALIHFKEDTPWNRRECMYRPAAAAVLTTDQSLRWIELCHPHFYCNFSVCYCYCYCQTYDHSLCTERKCAGAAAVLSTTRPLVRAQLRVAVCLNSPTDEDSSNTYSPQPPKLSWENLQSSSTRPRNIA